MSKSTNGNAILNREYIVASISAVVLSTTAIFIRYLTQTYHIPALVLAFWRDGFVALTLLAILRLFRLGLLHVKRKYILYLIVYGFVLALFNSLWTLSVAVNGAAVATVLVYCSTAFTALLGFWLLEETMGWAKFLAIILCLAGAVLVVDAMDLWVWRANPLGIVTGISSGLGYAVYSLMGRSAARRGLSPWTTVCYTFGFAALFLLLFNLVLGNFIPGSADQPADFFWLGNVLSGWGILFLLAAGPTLLGFGMYNTSLSYLPASIANLVVTLEPVFTALFAYFLLGERLSAMQLLGSTIILTAVVFLRFSEVHLMNHAEHVNYERLKDAYQPTDTEKEYEPHPEMP